MELKKRVEIITGIIRGLRGKADRLKLFKLSFLLSRTLQGLYDFVPYKFGPYSFEMDKDIRKLIKTGQITESDSFLGLNNDKDNEYIPQNIKELIDEFGSMDSMDLLLKVYEAYPYYTKFSAIKRYPVEMPVAEPAVYTIGYQDFSVDSFINTLIKSGIKRLIDVRNRPFSYKYGFTGNWLKKYLPEFEIEYAGIPAVGIPPSVRDEHKGEALWREYEKIMDDNSDSVMEIGSMLKDMPSALMCFEKEPSDCHRFRLACRINNIEGLRVVNYNKNIEGWVNCEYEGANSC